MSKPIEFELTPDEVLDYGWDLSAWLAAGDTIQSSTFSADAGVTISSPGSNNTTTSAFFSGLAAGARKMVTNIITTVGGRTVSRSFILVGVARRWG